jgi:hypothetical protein
MARVAAVTMHLEVASYPADWETYGRAAGPVRNKQMVIEGHANGVCAFHNDLEHSRGTRHMVLLARRVFHLPVWVSTEGPTHLDAFARLVMNP